MAGVRTSMIGAKTNIAGIKTNMASTKTTIAGIKTNMEGHNFLHAALAKPFHRIPPSVVDVVVKILNLFLFLRWPRQIFNGRYTSLHREALELASNLKETQFFKVYLRFSSKYKYHPLQRFEFMPRKFDLSDTLVGRMKEVGTQAFYEAICPKDVLPITANFLPDFTKIDEVSSLKASADFLYENLSKCRGKEIAGLSRDLYTRGYSRPIRVSDRADWNAFRDEWTQGIHLAARMNKAYSDVESNVSLIALSYKSNQLVRDRAFSTKDDECEILKFELKENVVMSNVYVEDFRWNQLIRTAVQIAAQEKTEYVRIWIDRFVMIERDDVYKKYIYEEKGVKWEDFGLWAYAVCPVIRLYKKNEKYYGTNFWRKLELVMAVAGKGIFLDDYVLVRFDNSIYYGKSLYKRLHNGICKIGGKGKYIRSVTLAVATAVLTDGVSVAGLNEHKETRRSINGWKAWALRTLAEGAYSSSHAVVLQVDPAFTVGLSQFCTIAFWESISTTNPLLEGDSYLDMSLQKSTEYRKNERWEGIHEWIGMVSGACEIKERDRDEISRYLNDCAQVQLYTNTTQQVAGLLTLRSKDYKERRVLAVELSRHSTVQVGQVTAVAEATGLNKGKSWLPWYLVHKCDPETDQTTQVTEDGALWFIYKPIRAFYKGSVPLVWLSALLYYLMWFILAIENRLLAGLYISIAVLNTFVYGYLLARQLSWPWKDMDLIGEGLFDNVLMHGIFEAGIKGTYRALNEESYSTIGWGDQHSKELGISSDSPV